jgi:acyl-CoA synthetase (AMP-forming)/AMP-acid ligase II
MSSHDANFAGHLSRMAARQPDAIALVCPKMIGKSSSAPRYSFRQLEDESELLARGMIEIGIEPGTRSLFMVQPGFSFFTLAFGLFKAGGVLVGVDPGMGQANMSQCLAEAEPKAFLGIPVAHFFRRLLGWAKKSVEINVTTSDRGSKRSGQVGLATLRELGRRSNQSLPTMNADDPAIIAFTSGSTGVPKGVLYTHGLLNAQVGMFRDCFGIEPGERDLVTFPHFAFFGPGLGVTLVLATMDFARPGRALPSWIVGSLQDHEITNMFGSPALLHRVARYGTARGLKLPKLRRVVCAGAPVPGHVVQQISSLLDGGSFYTPYGATEALPVSCISGEEILGDTQSMTEDGHGVCVGHPVDGVDVRIIRISDQSLDRWSDDLEVPAGTVGEITVAGPVVSKTYFRRPSQTALAKIPAGDDVFHRMGDLGYFDAQGRLWFCGRKSQRVVTPGGEHYTIPVEAVFNAHHAVFRSALVGVTDASGHARPVLCVQLAPDASRRNWEAIRKELLELAARRPSTSMIRDILLHRKFPVDPRHNAKIVREKLSKWAEKQLR